MKRIIASLLISAQFVFLGVSFVRADGMVISPPNIAGGTGRKAFDFVKETDQKAFINYEDGEEKMIISVSLADRQGRQAFWIFPVPASPETVKINILKEVPELRGEEVRQAAKINLNKAKSYLELTQIYPMLKDLLTVRTMSLGSQNVGSKGAGVLSAGGDYPSSEGSRPDVQIFEHIEKEGLISEVITAQTLNGLKEYLEKKSIDIDAESLPILGEYLGKNFSFVVSWMEGEKSSAADSMISAGGGNSVNLDFTVLYNSLRTVDEKANFRGVIYNFENENPELKELQRVADVVEKLASEGNIFPESQTIKEFPRIRKIVVDLEEKHPTLKANQESRSRINKYIKSNILVEIIDEIVKDPMNVDEIWKIADPMVKNRSLGMYDFNPKSEVDNSIFINFLSKNSYKKEVLFQRLLEKLPLNQSGKYIGTSQAGYQNKTSVSQKNLQKGIFVSFPTDKLYFPLYPTSVYGEERIPVEIRVMGIKNPKIYQNIENATKTEYFINNKANYTVENKDFFGSEVPSRYTKIKINTQPKFFTEDLWISSYPPISILPVIVMGENPVFLFIVLLIGISLLAGALATVILRKRIALSGERKITYIKYSLLNCFSLAALVVGLHFWKKKTPIEDQSLEEIEEENRALDKLRASGYSEWALRFLKYRKNRGMSGWKFSLVFSFCFLFLAWAVTLLLILLVSK